MKYKWLGQLLCYAPELNGDIKHEDHELIAYCETMIPNNDVTCLRFIVNKEFGAVIHRQQQYRAVPYKGHIALKVSMTGYIERLVRYAMSNPISNTRVISKIISVATTCEYPPLGLQDEPMLLVYGDGDDWILTKPGSVTQVHLPKNKFCKTLEDEGRIVNYHPNNLPWDIISDVSPEFSMYLKHLSIVRMNVYKRQVVEVLVELTTADDTLFDGLPEGWDIMAIEGNQVWYCESTYD